MIGIFIRRGKHDVQTETHSGVSCDDKGKDWSDTATSQGRSKIYCHHQMLGIGKEELCPESQREHGPAGISILDIWPP